MSHSKLHEDNREQSNRTEEAKNEGEERYRSLFITMAHGVVYQAASGEIISANPAAEKILGLTIDQMQGRSSMDPSWRAIHEDGSDYPGESHPSMVALKTGKEVNNVVMGVFNPNDEQTHWININAMPQFKSGENTPYQVYTTFEDITERKKAEEMIKESEMRLRTIFDQAAESLVLIDAETGALVEYNDKACEVLGYTKEEFRKLKIPDFEAVESLEEVRKHIEKILEEGSDTFESKHRTKDGEIRDVLVKSKTISLHNKDYIQSIWYNITERKKVEEGLRKSKELYHNLFEEVPIGLYRTTSMGEIIDANQALIRLFGYKNKKALMEVNTNDLYMNPEDRKRLMAMIEKKGIVNDFEVQLKHIRNKDIWVKINIHARKDDEGEVLYYEGSMEDITERKKAEEEMKIRLMKFKLKDGILYLVKEPFPALSLEAFNDLLKVGYHGIEFSRTPGNGLKKEFHGDVEIFWLSERGERSLTPSLRNIEKKIETLPQKTVVFIERFDYLITRNGFKEILLFLQNLRDIAFINNIVIIISLDPSTMVTRKQRLLDKEGEMIQTKYLGKLPNDMLAILKFIFRENTLGLKPSLTKIGREIRMSKPTVRGKVRKLIEAGYLVGITKGNAKVFELTERGRNLFLIK